MKRDMDLIRKLLLEVETSPGPALRKTPKFEGFSEDVIAEHVRLAFEAGLLEGAHLKLLSGPPQFANIALTWNGHEFLDATRSPEIWEKTKAVAAKVGSTSMKLMFEIATGYAKAELSRLGVPMI